MWGRSPTLRRLHFLAGLLPPAFAYMSAKNSTVQSLPDAQKLLAQGRKFYEASRFNDAAAIWQLAVAVATCQQVLRVWVSRLVGWALPTLLNLSLSASTFVQQARWLSLNLRLGMKIGLFLEPRIYRLPIPTS